MAYEGVDGACGAVFSSEPDKAICNEPHAQASHDERERRRPVELLGGGDASHGHGQRRRHHANRHGRGLEESQFSAESRRSRRPASLSAGSHLLDPLGR